MGWLDRIGAAGLFIFALATVFKTAPGHYGLALALPAGLAALARAGRAGWDTTARLTAVLALALTVRYALQRSGFGAPGLVDPAGGFLDWLLPLLFLPLAAMPAAQGLGRLAALWLLALLGHMAGVLGFLHERGVAVLWSGERLGFHLERPLGVGLYAGAFLLLLLATGKHWWNKPGPWQWPIRGLGAALLAMQFQILLAAQNRTTYLALPLALAVVAATVLICARSRPGFSLRQTLLAWGLVLALGGGLLAANHDMVDNRLAAEHETVTTLQQEGLEAAPITSITIRLRLWRHALRDLAEAPLLGHGFGGIHGLADEDPSGRDAPPGKGRYDHFHNSYIQLLWSQGLIGAVLWGALIFLLVRDVARQAHRSEAVRELLPAVAGMLAFVAIWGCFAYRLPHPDMRFFTILLLLSLRLLGQAPRAAALAASP